MSDEQTQLPVNYRVIPTKQAISQGKKLLNDDDRADIIIDMRLLRHWPANCESFEYEEAYGALEFKFDYVADKWIRVFVVKDDDRRIMWVVKVLAKKTNQLSKADKISIETSVARIKQEIREFNRHKKFHDTKHLRMVR